MIWNSSDVGPKCLRRSTPSSTQSQIILYTHGHESEEYAVGLECPIKPLSEDASRGAYTTPFRQMGRQHHGKNGSHHHSKQGSLCRFLLLTCKVRIMTPWATWPRAENQQIESAGAFDHPIPTRRDALCALSSI